MSRLRVLLSCLHVRSEMDWLGPELQRRGIDYDLATVDGQQLTEGELLHVIDRYDGVLAGDDEFTAPVLHAGTRLRIIAKWGIGVDAIDVETARALGISVRNTPGMFGAEIADYALTYLLLLFRQQHVIDRDVRSGAWPKLRGHSVAGHTLGIVGLGSSGRELARRAAVLGMQLLGFDPSPPPEDLLHDTGSRLVDLDELFSRSDVVSLHLPLTPQTRHLVDEERLGQMPVGSHLINTSRGPLVDEHALLKALEDGHLAGAALDVFEEEPLPAGHPFTRIDGMILGSHNASNTHEAVRRTTRRAFENLVDGLGVGS